MRAEVIQAVVVVGDLLVVLSVAVGVDVFLAEPVVGVVDVLGVLVVRAVAVGVLLLSRAVAGKIIREQRIDERGIAEGLVGQPAESIVVPGDRALLGGYDHAVAVEVVAVHLLRLLAVVAERVDELGELAVVREILRRAVGSVVRQRVESIQAVVLVVGDCSVRVALQIEIAEEVVLVAGRLGRRQRRVVPLPDFDGRQPAEFIVAVTGIAGRVGFLAGEGADVSAESVVTVLDDALGRVGPRDAALGVVGRLFGADGTGRRRARDLCLPAEGVVLVVPDLVRRAGPVVVADQVVKEPFFIEPARRRVVDELGDDALEADVQRLPALVIVLEPLGEVIRILGSLDAERQRPRELVAARIEREAGLAAERIDDPRLVAEGVVAVLVDGDVVGRRRVAVEVGQRDGFQPARLVVKLKSNCFIL